MVTIIVWVEWSMRTSNEVSEFSICVESKGQGRAGVGGGGASNSHFMVYVEK